MKDHLKKYIEDSRTPEVRGLRILLEYFHATEMFNAVTGNGIKVVSVFGSARIQPHALEYRLAYRVGQLLYKAGFAVVTGASRGVMQAANQGVADAIATEIVSHKKAKSLADARESGRYKKALPRYSVGLSISLPMEEMANPYVGTKATFHYFMVRKFFFGTLSSAFIACEGGWGTRDELFEMLTLVQTGKSPVMPIIYLSRDPKHLEQDIRHTIKKGYIVPEDQRLIQVVKTPEAAVRIIQNFYRNVKEVAYDRDNITRISLKAPPAPSLMKRVEDLLMENYPDKLPLEWRGSDLILRNYRPASYGTLRHVIDLLNE